MPVYSFMLKKIIFCLKVILSNKFMLGHTVVLSHRVSMVSHKVVLSRKVVLSWQALFRVPQVVSLRTSGGCGHRRNLGMVTE